MAHWRVIVAWIPVYVVELVLMVNPSEPGTGELGVRVNNRSWMHGHRALELTTGPVSIRWNHQPTESQGALFHDGSG